MCGGMFGVPFDRSRLNDVIALYACPVNTLPSLLTKELRRPLRYQVIFGKLRK